MAIDNFYVYIYLNPLKPGKYLYNGINFCFLYEPMYVGKGRKSRYLYHTRCANWKGCNSPFYDQIKVILNSNNFPIVVKLQTELTEKQSSDIEIDIISKIGRKDLGGGVLFNRTRGGDGIVGCTFSKERRKEISKRMSGNNNPASKLNMSYSKILAKAQKASKTTKRLGLLKGNNHPLYGKKHTIFSKKKISKNHFYCSGEYNSRAKKWKVISPIGIEYTCNGNLKKFCEEHEISIHTLKRNVGNGPINNVIGHGISKKTKGWSLFEL